MKVALYSALYGRYDWVKPVPQNLGVPAYLFTDIRDLDAPGWEVVYRPHGVATLKGSPRITAPMLGHKYWKCHPHLAVPDAEVTIWVDGSMEIVVDNYVERCLTALENDEWSCMRHPTRSCIYPEAELSAALTWRYDAESVRKQADFYRSIGYGPGLGLVATGANVRLHTDTVIEISEQWWQECLNWSHQDQLSLPVLFWLHPELKWNLNIPWHEWWILHGHGDRPHA